MKQENPEQMFSAFTLGFVAQKTIRKTVELHGAWERSNDRYRTQIKEEKQKIVNGVVQVLMQRIAVLSSFWSTILGPSIAYAVDSAITISGQGVTFEASGGYLSVSIENIRLLNKTNREIVETLNTVFKDPEGTPPLVVFHPHPNSDIDDDFSGTMATHAVFLLVLTTPQEFVLSEE